MASNLKELRLLLNGYIMNILLFRLDLTCCIKSNKKINLENVYLNHVLNQVLTDEYYLL